MRISDWSSDVCSSDLPTMEDAAAESRSSSARTEETVNYEITKTVETNVREAGTVKRLSVAVLVDGTYATAEDGSVTYEPRSAERSDERRVGKECVSTC